jgi:hypothetical protein
LTTASRDREHLLGGQRLATLRCDVLVLGSSLGALAAGTALARTGMRVVLVEEDVHAKRPSLLREPFLLGGLEAGGPVDGLLRELAIPLLERRELAFDPLATQVVLPGGVRLDVGGGRKALAAELAAFELADADPACAWFEQSDATGDAVRERLRDVPAPVARGLPGLAALRREPSIDAPAPDAPPPALVPLLDALEWALSGLAVPVRATARSLLLRATRDGVARPLHAGRGLLDLFRRRFAALHGEIRSAGEFAVRTEGREVGVELARDRVFARALLLGAPREPLARASEEAGDVPRWLSSAPPPQRVERRVLRAEAQALPIGMGSRLIAAGGSGDCGIFGLARCPDPTDRTTEWVVISGPGAAQATAGSALGGLAPFAEGRIVPIDPGPSPRWDLDSVELRFPEPRIPEVVKRSPLVLCVGPERAPELGFEGELLLARRAAHTAEAALGR